MTEIAKELGCSRHALYLALNREKYIFSPGDSKKAEKDAIISPFRKCPFGLLLELTISDD